MYSSSSLKIINIILIKGALESNHFKTLMMINLKWIFSQSMNLSLEKKEEIS